MSTQEHADFLAVVGLTEAEVAERLRIAALPPAQAAIEREAAQRKGLYAPRGGGAEEAAAMARASGGNGNGGANGRASGRGANGHSKANGNGAAEGAAAAAAGAEGVSKRASRRSGSKNGQHVAPANGFH